MVLRAWSGEANLVYDGQGQCGWDWQGCEALRLFDDGDLVCEIIWDAVGPCTNWNGGNQATYQLEFELNEAQTTCTPQLAGSQDYQLEDQEWRYRLEWEDDEKFLEISWAYPDSNDFSWWSSTAYTTSSEGSVVDFEYKTDFTNWEN